MCLFTHALFFQYKGSKYFLSFLEDVPVSRGTLCFSLLLDKS